MRYKFANNIYAYNKKRKKYEESIIDWADCLVGCGMQSR